MKNSVQKLAGKIRKRKGNETRKSKIKVGHVGIDGVTAADVRQEIIRQSKLSNERKEQQKRLSVRNFCRKMIRQKLYKIAFNLPDEGYSMGGVREVHCCGVTGKYDNSKEYARSSRYSAKHSHYSVTITPDMYRKSEVIHGIVTMPGEIFETDRDSVIRKAVWFDSNGKKQHFELVKKQGFIAQLGSRTFHSENLETAREWVQDERKRLTERKERERLERKQKKEYERRLEEAKRKFYGLKHARKAGFCESGIKRFINRNDLDESMGYRGDYLLEISSTQKNLVEEMVQQMAE